MSFCNNCGANIGDNKFCSYCGTASSTHSDSSTSSTATHANFASYSSYYPLIKEYRGQATGFFVFGLLSLIFSMGIGLIFEIIGLVKSSKMKKFEQLFDPNLPITNPEERALLRSARSKHRTGRILLSIALIITGVLLAILTLLLI